MTIPAPSAPRPSESTPSGHAPGSAPTTPQGGNDLGWLLQNLLDEATGTLAAVLAAPDGLPMAYAGLPEVEAAKTAAVASTLFSTSKACGNISTPHGGDPELIAITHLYKHVFLMSTDPPRSQAHDGVAALLVVQARKDADTRLIGGEMTRIVDGVSEHLRTTARPTVDDAADTTSEAGIDDAR